MGGVAYETWLPMEVQLLYWSKTLDDFTLSQKYNLVFVLQRNERFFIG